MAGLRNLESRKMNEEIMKKVGFAKEVDLIKQGKCPHCGKKIDTMTEFRDELSTREHAISRLCQKCQDEVFGK